jgi:hypothetical protein
VVIGTAISITGTNFDPTVGNNRVTVNASNSKPTSATSTTIALNVPTNTSSGHLSVATSLGQTATNSYLYVAPSPYTAANVGYTGSVSIGGSAPATISTAGQIGLMVFDGTAGQQVSVQTTSLAFGGCNVSISILNPDGSTLTNNGCMGNGGFIGAQSLPKTGTYTLLIVPGGSGTGSLTVSLNDAANITGTITPGGPAVNVNLARAGQTARLTFGARVGQKVSVQTVGGTLTGCDLGINILNPDGSYLTGNGCVGDGGFIDETTLNQTGTFTLYVYAGQKTGTQSVQLWGITDFTGPITPGGSAVNLNIAPPGQKARLTFSGSAGQQVSAHTSNSTFAGCNLGMSILNPDGSYFTGNGCMGGNNSLLGPVTLGTTGTYTLYVYAGASTGSLTVNLTSP